MWKQIIRLGKKGRNTTEMLRVYRPDLFLTMLSAVFKELLCSGRSSERTANMKLKWLLMCWNRMLIPPNVQCLLKHCVTCNQFTYICTLCTNVFKGQTHINALKFYFNLKGIKTCFLCPHKQSMFTLCTVYFSLIPLRVQIYKCINCIRIKTHKNQNTFLMLTC